ncbi:hypothetical protein [Sporichthya polymorpha]|uniref:hypothetical protein n=1 Tax=Sporichthya polymorpha TaxID=35751 RepID=UPI0003657C8B|nr:hypothetical protein [Sporichthya polymorpha]
MIDLYWLPLGAGGHVVRWNGRVYEHLQARREHRPPGEIHHAALDVTAAGTRTVIEMAPVWNCAAPDRGTVVVGPVGAAVLGRFRMFRYEVRCWRNGRIPDAAEATAIVRVSRDERRAAAVLDSVPQVPPLTWGRDDLGCGEMWNSNSLVAWLLAVTGHEMAAIRPPAGARAPGWSAGLALADRERQMMTRHTTAPQDRFPATASESSDCRDK